MKIFARKMKFTTILLIAFAASGCANLGLRGIPSRPEKLAFHPRNYVPPKPSDYRHVLSNGTVVYLAEDHAFPLIDVNVIVRTGTYLDPAEKVGLAGLVGTQIRAGGTTHLSAQAFDEEVDYLAASISSNINETQGNAYAGCLSKDIDRVLDLFFDMLRNPAFGQDRLDLAKAQALEAMKRRNDSTTSIEGREWTRLLRGDAHFSSKQMTQASLASISRDDLSDFHRRFYHPDRMILAVSGDFKSDEMLNKLEKRFAGWEKGSEPAGVIPKPNFDPQPGLYLAHKPEVNQGRISVGHLGTTRDNPDRWALMVMNNILGGGGFTSRIMSRVRSDEGLAYSAGSSFGLGIYYDGIFRAAFQSKNPTCAQATKIVLEEIERIRNEKVGAGELNTEINSIVESFPRQFANAGAIAGTFADDEYTGRDPKYWQEFQAGVRSVSAEDVQRVARKYLAPEKLVILAVGNMDEILKGDPNKPQFSLEKLAPGGKVARIPLPDPLTLAYPPAK